MQTKTCPRCGYPCPAAAWLCRGCQFDFRQPAPRQPRASLPSWLILTVVIFTALILLGGLWSRSLMAPRLGPKDGLLVEPDWQLTFTFSNQWGVVGTVRNDTGHPLTEVMVAFSLRDNSGAQTGIATDTTPLLAAGDRWRFEALTGGMYKPDDVRLIGVIGR